jgi:polyphosphate kinase 2 (PPK2 family)
VDKKVYKKELYDLQVELVKFQRDVISNKKKVCIIFEGRDTAGKDGTIKRFTEHLSPRETRVVALGKPSDKVFQPQLVQPSGCGAGFRFLYR